MKFQIKSETKNKRTARMRVHMAVTRMTFRQADTLMFYLQGIYGIEEAKVYEKTCDAVIVYSCDRAKVIKALQDFSYEKTAIPNDILNVSGREINAKYQDRLVNKLIFHYARKWLLPTPIRACYTTLKSFKYIYEGLKCIKKGKIEVPVLDATAIGVSVIRGDFNTAGSVMFLLGVGELLEEWTHKKSVDDLARSMSLNISKVWLKSENGEVLVSADTIKAGDMVVVHMGNVIPFDGTVTGGEALVNQSSLTGESLPVRRTRDNYVYAGTVVEEGELTVQVKEAGGFGRFEKIVTMIEESEKLKSGLEGKAEHLADRLVPWTLLGTGATYLFTGNVTKTLSVLMVDFSCALKMAMPISVLSAIREAGKYKLTVKGGKYLEAVAEADTIVFDKTGTLTKAKPTVQEVVSFNGDNPRELLRLAACLEEHFPHSMAKAVVNKAMEEELEHEEMHSTVEYVVAHGISSKVGDKKVVIGSYHFVFEDEKCIIPQGMEQRFAELPKENSHLYLAIENSLAAVIIIRDPLREEAAEVVAALKEAGISKVVMMTGDNEHTARSIAAKVGVDEYYSEVLPEDKARFVEAEKKAGRKVIMIGDGINDSPALSAADVGIAISDGAEIAREIADITISSDDLHNIVILKHISDLLMKRIKKNYHRIVTINTGLILLGVGGILQPATSALWHNASTIAISLGGMKSLIEEK